MSAICAGEHFRPYNIGTPERIMMRVSEKWYLYESNGIRPPVGSIT